MSPSLAGSCQTCYRAFSPHSLSAFSAEDSDSQTLAVPFQRSKNNTSFATLSSGFKHSLLPVWRQTWVILFPVGSQVKEGCGQLASCAVKPVRHTQTCPEVLFTWRVAGLRSATELSPLIDFDIAG